MNAAPKRANKGVDSGHQQEPRATDSSSNTVTMQGAGAAHHKLRLNLKLKPKNMFTESAVNSSINSNCAKFGPAFHPDVAGESSLLMD